MLGHELSHVRNRVPYAFAGPATAHLFIAGHEGTRWQEECTSKPAMARILVGYDGSEAARKAAKFAAHLARRLKDAVTLAYVVPPAPAEIAVSPVLDPERAARDHLAYAEELLRKAVAEIGPDVEVAMQILGGHPAAALEELARDHDVELVVVGSHGLNPIERALLGSTASRLIRTCRKPVVVIPAPSWRSAGA